MDTAENVKSRMEKKNGTYWAYNLPLQWWPVREKDLDGEEQETGPVADYRILNYMARKEYCTELKFSEVSRGQTKEEFLEQAALVCENLAKQFRAAKTDDAAYVYYPDNGME